MSKDTTPEVLSWCKAVLGYPPDYEVCKGRFLADGSMSHTCGDACSFVMMKGGAGDPPFHWMRKKFVGDQEVPGAEWEPG